MIALFLSVLISHANPEYIPVTYVDAIEINHIYSVSGDFVFDQVVFWNYSKREDFNFREVVDWRIIKDVRVDRTEEDIKKIKQFFTDNKIELLKINNKYVGPNICKTNNRYSYVFYDGEVLRKIIGKTYYETYTKKDSEIKHRELMGQDLRKKLRNFIYIERKK